MIRNLLTARRSGATAAVLAGDCVFTYHDLSRMAAALRGSLQREPQGPVAVVLPNGGGFIAALWGVLSSGRTAVPLNPQLTPHELLPLLRQSGAAAVITCAAVHRRLDALAARDGFPLRLLRMEELVLTADRPADPPPAIAPEEPMLLLSTSGTTGQSKLVQLSEANVDASVTGYLEKIRLDPMEKDGLRFLLAAPFSSSYGIMILCACLRESIPVVVLEEPGFTLEALYRTAARHRVTHYEGSAAAVLLMDQLAGRPIPYDVKRLRYFGFGGSKVAGSTVRRLMQAYPGCSFFQGYGMTEAGPLITKHPREALRKTDSAGTAIRGVELAVKTEEGIVQRPDVTGEILVRGPNVMLGYFNDPDATRQTLRDGYLHTGDIGYLDEEGYLYLCGRKKSMINCRGFKVYPEELEACLRHSGLVKDCYVYGRAGALESETICMEAVPLHPGVEAEAIRAYCASHLARYKQPQVITLCGEIQRSAADKIKRTAGPPL